MWAVRRVGAPFLSPGWKDRGLHGLRLRHGGEQSQRRHLDRGGRGRSAAASHANKASDSSPAWSPDGKRIAFVSKRDGDSAAQLYVISVEGGEAERMTEMPLAVSNPAWFPDGTRIAFVSHVIAGAESLAETKKALEAREKNKVKARVTENRLYRFWDRWLTDDEYPRIFVLDLPSRKVTDLLPGSKRYFDLQEGTGSFDIAPDGSAIVFEANSSEEPYKTTNADTSGQGFGRRSPKPDGFQSRRRQGSRLQPGREERRLWSGAKGRRLAGLDAARPLGSGLEKLAAPDRGVGPFRERLGVGFRRRGDRASRRGPRKDKPLLLEVRAAAEEISMAARLTGRSITRWTSRFFQSLVTLRRGFVGASRHEAAPPARA